MFKQTPGQKKQSEKLWKLVQKGRGKIGRKRKKETRILATLETALEIVSDKKFWVQGTWFDGGLGASASKSLPGSPASYDNLKEQEEINGCSLEDKVCKVCAEGAIYLAADTLVDGDMAIIQLNDALDKIYSADYNKAEEEYKKKNPNDPHCWDMDWDHEWEEADIQTINDHGDRDKAHKATVSAFKAGIAQLKKDYKVS